MIALHRRTWSRFVAIGTPFLQSDVRWKALALLALLIALLLSISGLNILNSYVGRDFMTAVAQREVSRFSALALRYAGVFAVTTIAFIVAAARDRVLGSWWIAWLGIAGALAHGAAGPLVVIWGVEWARELFPLIVLVAAWLVIAACWPARTPHASAAWTPQKVR